MKHPDSIHGRLEKHFKHYGLRPAKKVKYRDQDVYLAEGGIIRDCKDWKVLDKNEGAPAPGFLNPDDAWMKDGYYASAFALIKNDAVFGVPMYFKLDHDLNLTQEQRAEARLQAALVVAKDYIDNLINVGMLHTDSGIKTVKTDIIRI